MQRPMRHGDFRLGYVPIRQSPQPEEVHLTREDNYLLPDMEESLTDPRLALRNRQQKCRDQK